MMSRRTGRINKLVESEMWQKLELSQVSLKLDNIAKHMPVRLDEAQDVNAVGVMRSGGRRRRWR